MSVNVPYNHSPNTVIKSSEENANNEALANEINDHETKRDTHGVTGVFLDTAGEQEVTGKKTFTAAPVITRIKTPLNTTLGHLLPDAPDDEIVLANAPQMLTNKNLGIPTITDFTNSPHNHSDAHNGGNVSHLDLLDIGNNGHIDIDNHIADDGSSGAHGAVGKIVSENAVQGLSNKAIYHNTSATHEHGVNDTSDKIYYFKNGSINPPYIAYRGLQNKIYVSQTGLAGDELEIGSGSGGFTKYANYAALPLAISGDCAITLDDFQPYYFDGNDNTWKPLGGILKAADFTALSLMTTFPKGTIAITLDDLKVYAFDTAGNIWKPEPLSVNADNIDSGTLDDARLSTNIATQTDVTNKIVANNAITQEPSGFSVSANAEAIMSFNNGTRTFTIAPTGASFGYYNNGVLVSKTTENIVISNTSGTHFIYYVKSTNILTESTSPWDFELHIPIATVYWNTIDNAGYISEERHGYVMDWVTHKVMHQGIRTRYISGFGLSGYVINDTTDAGKTFGITGGTINDEDIAISAVHSATPSNRWEQILNDPAELPIFHLGAGNVWRKAAATQFCVLNAGSGRVAYNNTVGFTQVEAASTNYVAYWVLASNFSSEPVYIVQGQRQDTTLANAQNNNSFSSLVGIDALTAEYKVLYRIIVQTNLAYGTKAFRIAEVSDFRSVSTLAGANVPLSDHNTLTGRDAANAHPGSAISNTATGYGANDILTSSDIDVQTALNTLSLNSFKKGNVPILLSDTLANIAAKATNAGAIYNASDFSYQMGIAIVDSGAKKFSLNREIFITSQGINDTRIGAWSIVENQVVQPTPAFAECEVVMINGIQHYRLNKAQNNGFCIIANPFPTTQVFNKLVFSANCFKTTATPKLKLDVYHLKAASTNMSSGLPAATSFVLDGTGYGANVLATPGSMTAGTTLGGLAIDFSSILVMTMSIDSTDDGTGDIFIPVNRPLWITAGLQ